VGRIFKLKDRSRAILSENNQRSVIAIPAEALVVLVGGDIDEDIFVKVRYKGKVFHMLSEELRSSGELDNRRSFVNKQTTSPAMIKVSPEVLDWLNEEQHRRWQKTGREPTPNELIREVMEVARHPERIASHSNEPRSLQLSEETRKHIQLLISALESGWNDSIAAVRQNLHRIYLMQQAAVLQSAQQKGTLHAAALIARFLRSGATLRWGQQGWDVQKTGMLLSSETVEQLNELGFITRESEMDRDEGRPGEFVHDLLSNQGIEGLDKISRRAFRANQNRAYFEYLDELLELYQQHSTLREGVISYPALVREKIRFAYHFAWLYLAGILHLFGITEELRVRIAQYSLGAIGSLIG
jgi:hypothetical protein